MSRGYKGHLEEVPGEKEQTVAQAGLGHCLRTVSGHSPRAGPLISQSWVWWEEWEDGWGGGVGVVRPETRACRACTKLPTSAGSWKKQESSRKTSISALPSADAESRMRSLRGQGRPWRIFEPGGGDLSRRGGLRPSLIGGLPQNRADDAHLPGPS